VFETVALAIGEAPGGGAGRGLSRCTSRIHFITVNPITAIRTQITSGMSERRPPLLLRLRIVTGRVGSGSGASCR
jgi:hypothetical protein